MSASGNEDRLIVTCPCGFEMEVSAADIGRTGECARCGESIVVTQDNARPISPVKEKKPRSEPVSNVIRSGRYPEAVKRLRTTLGRDETKLEVWYALAYCYYKLGDYNEAQMIAKRAEQLGHPSARDLRKRILLKIQEVEAEAVLDDPRALRAGIAKLPPLPGSC